MNGGSGNPPFGMVTNNFWQTTTPAQRIGKVRGYIEIPALGYLMFPSCGASYCVTSFTFQSNCHNLTFPFIDQFPTDFGYNFNIALRYSDPQTGEVIRYKLWDFGDAPIDCSAPPYEGQTIWGGNFLVEVWSRGANIGLSMPQNICLLTSIRRNIHNLPDPEFFQVASAIKCSTLYTTNGLQVPLQFAKCAAGQTITGNQLGPNYIFDQITGMFMLFNTTTGEYNCIFTQGQSGQEYIVVRPPIQPNVAPSTTIPLQGANYRINSTTGAFELLNLTTGEYNTINTQGNSGSETIIIQPQEP